MTIECIYHPLFDMYSPIKYSGVNARKSSLKIFIINHKAFSGILPRVKCAVVLDGKNSILNVCEWSFYLYNLERCNKVGVLTTLIKRSP